MARITVIMDGQAVILPAYLIAHVRMVAATKREASGCTQYCVQDGEEYDRSERCDPWAF